MREQPSGERPHRRLVGGRLAWLAVGALAVTALAAPFATSAANPPGNNGTIKLDRLPFDTDPNNQPHVGCTFQVDWYGFDQGQLFSDVSFAVHPPTGKDVVIKTDRIFIGEDDNSGGGSTAGLDAQRTYNLSSQLAAYDPHPKPGYPRKLTIHADRSQGAATKYKVFWIQACTPPPTPTPTPTPTP